MTVRTPRTRPQPSAWHESGASRYFIAGLVLLGLLVVGSQIIAGNSAALKDKGACEKACTDAGSKCRDNCQVLKTAERGACEKVCELQTNTCKASCKADPSVSFCSDTDGGVNIAVPGTCTDSSGVAGGVAYTWNAGTSSWDVSYISSSKDSCGYVDSKPGYLFEAYCVEYPIGKKYCAHATIECPFGCADGACISTPPS